MRAKIRREQSNLREGRGRELLCTLRAALQQTDELEEDVLLLLALCRQSIEGLLVLNMLREMIDDIRRVLLSFHTRHLA